MNVIKIRLGPKGPRLPFSLAYLFRGWDLHLMRRHFETFLGFQARHFEHPLDEMRVGDNDNGAALLEIVPDLTELEANWHFAVPILTGRVTRKLRWKRKQGAKARDLYDEPDIRVVDTGPFVMYLTEEHWKNWNSQKKGAPTPNAPYPDTGYLSTLKGILSPPCLACPRLLLHEAGECEIGDATCFAELQQFKVQGQMQRHLERYDDLMKPLEEVNVLDADSDRPDPDANPDAEL